MSEVPILYTNKSVSVRPVQKCWFPKSSVNEPLMFHSK